MDSKSSCETSWKNNYDTNKSLWVIEKASIDPAIRSINIIWNVGMKRLGSLINIIMKDIKGSRDSSHSSILSVLVVKIANLTSWMLLWIWSRAKKYSQHRSIIKRSWSRALLTVLWYQMSRNHWLQIMKVNFRCCDLKFTFKKVIRG
jgi:hypothetical protein